MSDEDRAAVVARARRLRRLRRELVGTHGGPLLAAQLGLPFRTWMGFEAGRAVPERVVRRLAALATVNPDWIQTGDGPKYARDRGRGNPRGGAGR